MGYISKSQKGPPQPGYRSDGQKTNALTSGINQNRMNHVRKNTGHQPAAHDLPTQTLPPSLRHPWAPDASRPGTHPRHISGPRFQKQNPPATNQQRTLSRPPQMNFKPETSGLKTVANPHRPKIVRFQLTYVWLVINAYPRVQYLNTLILVLSQ